MPGIERQSDYYGFIPEVAQRTAAREAGAAFDLPSDEDITGLLSGPSITAGMNDHRTRPTIRTADHGDKALLDGIAAENGWAVESVSDPGGAQRSMYRDGTEYVIGVRWKKFSPDVVEVANLSTQDPLGWPREGLGETTNLNVVKDWLQHSFLDDPADIYASKVRGTGFRPGPAASRAVTSVQIRDVGPEPDPSTDPSWEQWADDRDAAIRDARLELEREVADCEGCISKNMDSLRENDAVSGNDPWEMSDNDRAEYERELHERGREWLLSDIENPSIYCFYHQCEYEEAFGYWG